MASAPYTYSKSGYLQKRQRGLSKSEGDRKNLKFQQRFCVLRKDEFVYYQNEKVCV